MVRTYIEYHDFSCTAYLMSILSGIRQLFKSPFDHGVAHDLYVTIVRQTRLAVFYDDFGVHDTPEGRYDLLALHTYLVLRRLREESEKTDELAQALFDLMFADIDQNLREMGYGDTGIAKRVRKMAEGFYGRINAYDQGLDETGKEPETGTASPSVLERALDRNLYRDANPSKDVISAMARYVRAQAAHLADQGIDTLVTGQLTFTVPVLHGGE